MATIKFYLDGRIRKDGTAPIIMLFSDKQCRKTINLGMCVNPKFWNEKKTEVSSTFTNAPQINMWLQSVKSTVDNIMLRSEYLGLYGEDLFNELERAIFPNRAEEKRIQQEQQKRLLYVANQFAKLKKPSTRLTYERTITHLEKFIAQKHSDKFDEINKTWLAEFDVYLMPSCPSPNSRSIHLRNLRAIINFAIDEGITNNYPFRRFKIKTAKTAKRSLSVETLREVLSYNIEDWQVIYRDMFALSFMLMGINFVDLLNLKPGDFRDGRIEFNRAKTARLYSMKVEPEALEIINKYVGDKHLLSIMDSRSDYMQFIRQTNNALRKIGDCERHGLGGKKTHNAICPDLSTYWARHTWATIAASLDIPKETIAAALGHGGNTVTDIYIDFDRRKVDRANRKVLDWVLYGKGNIYEDMAVS